jgi:hypothetical protein
MGTQLEGVGMEDVAEIAPWPLGQLRNKRKMKVRWEMDRTDLAPILDTGLDTSSVETWILLPKCSFLLSTNIQRLILQVLLMLHPGS